MLFDFDGTLAPIVDDPDAADLAPGTFDLLDGLSRRYRTVGVVSGRPLAFLATRVPPSLSLSGLYGLETLVDRTRVDRPGLEVWRDRVTIAVARAAELGPAGMRTEAKGASATLHHRGHPELAEQVRRVAEAVALETGLEARAAKMSMELHPPIDTDKGHAVRELAGEAAAIAYVGDDRADLPAFRALVDLRSEGRHTVAVAVDSAELPGELRSVADVIVDGPAGVVDLLRSLLA